MSERILGKNMKNVKNNVLTENFHAAQLHLLAPITIFLLVFGYGQTIHEDDLHEFTACIGFSPSNDHFYNFSMIDHFQQPVNDWNYEYCKEILSTESDRFDFGYQFKIHQYRIPSNFEHR